MNGIIIADKPAGWTSHDVVAKLRGALKIKRVGHGGTLDPMAIGVLPVFIGRATRAAEFLENAEKEYIAGLKLGIVTDTQDITGNILSENMDSVPLDAATALSDVIPRFIGAQKQIPPMHSAIKQGGKKLYELARQGVEVPREPRDITISEIELLDVGSPGIGLGCRLSGGVSGGCLSSGGLDGRLSGDGLGGNLSSDSPGGSGNEFLLRVACSKGTYIRTLCHDIGTVLGCGGTMSSLQRTRAGIFTLGTAHTLDVILSAISSGEIENILMPVDSIFSAYPSATLNEATTRRCKNGVRFRVEDTADGMYRFYGPDDEFLMLGEVGSGEIKMVKGFYETVQG